MSNEGGSHHVAIGVRRQRQFETQRRTTSFQSATQMPMFTETPAASVSETARDQSSRKFRRPAFTKPPLASIHGSARGTHHVAIYVRRQRQSKMQRRQTVFFGSTRGQRSRQRPWPTLTAAPAVSAHGSARGQRSWQHPRLALTAAPAAGRPSPFLAALFSRRLRQFNARHGKISTTFKFAVPCRIQ